jgi:hypothetical protein
LLLLLVVVPLLPACLRMLRTLIELDQVQLVTSPPAMWDGRLLLLR